MLSLKRAFDAVHEIGIQARQSHEAGPFAQQVADVLDRSIGWEHGAVLLLGRDDRLEPLGLSRPDERPEALEEDRAYVRSRLSEPRQGLTGWVAEHGESVLVDDVRQDSRYFSMRADIRSELCVPIRVAARTLGVLNTESPRPDAYTSEHRRFLEVVAVEVAAVVVAERRARPVTLCSSCKSTRHADGTWSSVEKLLDERGLTISHGLCPTCLPRYGG